MLLSASYAWLQLTLNGTKTNVIKVGDLSLELDDTNGVAIDGNGVVPVLDAVGLEENPYTFKLINKGTTDSNYTIYLDNVNLEEGETQLPDDAIKFDLKQDGTTLVRSLLSYVKQNNDRILYTGIIKSGETLIYDLRMWVDQDATSTMAAEKTFRGKIRVEAEQVVEHAPTPEECFQVDGPGTTIIGYLCGTNKIQAVDTCASCSIDYAPPNTPQESPAGRIITDVVIPKTINGKTITKIGTRAFGNDGGSAGLTSVVIPEGITEIGYAAFFANQFTSVVIPEGVTIIESDAFYEVPLKNVYLPESLVEIGSTAFFGNLTSVVIPANVKKIGYAAFGDNSIISFTIKGKESTADFEIWGGSDSPFYGPDSGWLRGSNCDAHFDAHVKDPNYGDNTNPCIHWEP